MPREKAVVVLLDYLPRSWESRDEFHFRLAKKLVAKGIVPVFVYSGPLPALVEERFLSSGAKLHSMNYGQGRRAYSQLLGRFCSEYDVRLAHIRYFNYFSLLPWIARRHGVRNIIFTEANSGQSNATGWKKSLLRLRTKLVTQPLSRAIAISRFVKEGLMHVGIPDNKIHVVYNGVDDTAYSPDCDKKGEVRQEYQLAPNDLLLVTVADFRPMKNHDIMLKALAMLPKRGVNAKLIVAGDGPLRESLFALPKQLNIEGKGVWL